MDLDAINPDGKTIFSSVVPSARKMMGKRGKIKCQLIDKYGKGVVNPVLKKRMNRNCEDVKEDDREKNGE